MGREQQLSIIEIYGNDLDAHALYRAIAGTQVKQERIGNTKRLYYLSRKLAKDALSFARIWLLEVKNYPNTDVNYIIGQSLSFGESGMASLLPKQCINKS